MADDIVVGVLRALLKLDAAEFETGVKNIGTSMKQVETSFKQTGAQLTKLGTGLTTALTVPLLGIGAALFKVGTEFDKASDTIRESTGASGKALDDLNASFKRVAAEVPNGLQDVATALADVSRRTGASGGDLEILTTQLLNLARVSDTQVAPLIATTTRAFGDWSISTDKQAGALDFLFRTSQQTGIGVTRLTDLVVQFGAPLRALGFDFESSTALMGKFEKEGVNLETVMSGLRFALGEFAKAGKDPEIALRQVQAAILGAKTESEATAIAFQTFGKRAAIDMSRAIIEGRFNIDEFVTTLKGSQETINGAAADTLSLSERFSLLGHRVAVAVEPIATAFIGALEKALTAVEPFLAQLGHLATAFAAWPDWAQTAVLALGAVAAAIGPVLFGIGQLMTAASLIAGAFTTTGVATSALTTALGLLRIGVTSLLGPIGLAVTALGLLYAASQKYHIASGLTTEEIKKQIEELKKAGGTMALSRARSLEHALAERERQEALAAATAAQQTQTTTTLDGTAALQANTAAADASTEALFRSKAELAAAKEAADKAAKAYAEMFGTDLFERAAQAITILGGVQNITKLTAEKQVELRELITDTIEAYQRMGTTVPPQLEIVRDALIGVINEGDRLYFAFYDAIPAAIKSANTSMTAVIASWREGLANLTYNTLPNLINAQNASAEAADIAHERVVAAAKKDKEAHEALIKSIDDLGKGFVAMAQIGGESISSLTRGIGTMIAAVSTGITSVDTLKKGWNSFTTGSGLSSILGGLGGIVGGIGGIVGAAQAAVGAIHAMWEGLRRLFGGGEEGVVVNPARDQFWEQYGGYEQASMMLTRRLEELGDSDPGGTANNLIQAAFSADSKEEFDAAQDAIISLIGGQKFHRGGVVGGVGDVLGLLRAGERVLTQEQNRWFSDLMTAFPDVSLGGGALERVRGGADRPIVIHLSTYLDGRVVARQVIQHMPNELAVHGVRP